MSNSTLQNWLKDEYRRRFDDNVHQSFHGGGYSNFGYWAASTAVCQYGDELVDRLIAFIPSTEGKILDVACGQGGTTKRLSTYFPPSNITAINLFKDQLDAAKDRAPPGCEFLQMDATRLNFPDETFEVVICVEAAFHFEMREDFFRESCRVLKSGGHLILSDVIFRGPCVSIPEENIVSQREYEEIIERVGFCRPKILNVRDRTWVPFRRRYFWHSLKMGHWRKALAMWSWSRIMDKRLENYLLVLASKPTSLGGG